MNVLELNLTFEVVGAWIDSTGLVDGGWGGSKIFSLAMP